MRFVAAIAMFVMSAPACAQPVETFEVAALKRSAPGTQFSSHLDAAQFRCSGHTLLGLIMSAWPDIEVQPWKLAGGPPWLMTDYWDVSAKLPPKMPTDQEHLNRRTEAMLRLFLADQFKLHTHRETKEYAVYALVPAKSGTKLKPSQADRFNVKFSKEGLEFHHASMGNLVSDLFLPQATRWKGADRPVIDMTRLEGFFDFTLEWAQEADPDATGPSLYTALEEQLGLKLEPRRLPVEFLVIDHVERPEVH